MNLKRIFKNFNHNKSGCLGRKEFGKLIKIIDETVTEEEIDYIFKIFDLDNDMTISFTEFESYLT